MIWLDAHEGVCPPPLSGSVPANLVVVHTKSTHVGGDFYSLFTRVREMYECNRIQGSVLGAHPYPLRQRLNINF